MEVVVLEWWSPAGRIELVSKGGVWKEGLSPARKVEAGRKDGVRHEG
jgi:hypothetical protein